MENIKVISEAFPPGVTPPLTSKVHQNIANHLKNKQPIPQAIIRRGEAKDIEQLRQLQREWFPLSYSQSFYSKILTDQAQFLVAQIQLLTSSVKQPQKAIVGAIVYQLTTQSDHLEDIWLNRMLTYSQNAVYIMTLGVVDQLRSTGLARRLLQELYNFIASKSRIKVVTLHVVGYNKRAIAFYKKNGYILLESIEDHYHIMGKEYGGLKLGLFVNGGQQRQGWIRWFRKIFGKDNISEDYL